MISLLLPHGDLHFPQHTIIRHIRERDFSEMVLSSKFSHFFFPFASCSDAIFLTIFLTARTSAS